MERSATKTCYVGGGYYAPAPSSATASGCNNGGAVVNLVRLTRAGGDDGETFSYWPPDGGDSAVVDGQSYSATTGIATAFCLYHVKNATITGLTFRNFQIGPLKDDNWDADDGDGTDNAFSLNEILNSNYNLGSSPAVEFAGWVENASALNNYIDIVSGEGIGAGTTQSLAQGGLKGLMISGNGVLNSCTAVSDCGAIYIQDYQVTASTVITAKGNYVSAVNAAGSGGTGIYLDDGTSNVTAIGNVVIAAGAMWTCFLVHGGASDVYRNNVCDEAGGTNILFYQQTTHMAHIQLSDDRKRFPVEHHRLSVPIHHRRCRRTRAIPSGITAR